MERLLGPATKTGWGAAEGLLGIVAVVLVVWLLWPEDQGPELNKRVAWEQSVRAAEQRLERQEAERALENVRASQDVAAPSPDDSDATSVRSIEPAAAPERRRIASLSELADPLDELGRRQGSLSASGSFRPAPSRPVLPERDRDQADVASLDAEAQSSPGGGETLGVRKGDSSTLDAEAVDYAAQPQAEIDAPSSAVSSESADLEIASLSNGGPGFDPLPRLI